MIRALVASSVLVFILSTIAPCVNAQDTGMVVEKGKKVSFDYVLTVDGEQMDSSEGRGPLTYTHGQGQIISGLAARMEGMKIGEERVIEVPPEEAYGQSDPAAMKAVLRDSLPEDLDPKPGMFLTLNGPEGEALPVRIAEVSDDSIVLDLNHPLAGKTLIFDVKIVSIE